MGSAPDLRRGAMNARWIDRGCQNARGVSGDMVKSANLYVAEVATAVQQLARLSRRETGNVRRRLDVVETNTGFLGFLGPRPSGRLHGRMLRGSDFGAKESLAHKGERRQSEPAVERHSAIAVASEYDPV